MDALLWKSHEPQPARLAQDIAHGRVARWKSSCNSLPPTFHKLGSLERIMDCSSLPSA
jgi:hypothetical protein